MKQLNLQERKLNIIEHLIILNDEEVIEQVEVLINSYFKRPQPKKFTQNDLEKRAKISDENIEKGEIYQQEEVEKLSKNPERLTKRNK